MTAAPDWPPSPFWDFSLAVYGRSGVEAACLELQRRHDLDVNLLLWCCWLATRGVRLDEAAAAHAGRAALDWQREVVRPLRALRRRQKARLADPDAGSVPDLFPELAGAFRARVLALEIDGEHLEQLLLTHFAAGFSADAAPGVGLAAANLRRFWTFAPADRDALAAILGAVFPDAGSAALADAVSATTAPPDAAG